MILTAAVSSAAPTGVVSGTIFDGLVDYDRDLKPIPALATAWETARDGLSLTLHLRSGVSWHDGQPFTAADVKWTLENVWTKIHPRDQISFGPDHLWQGDDRRDARSAYRDPAPQPALACDPIVPQYNGARMLPKHLYEGTDGLSNPYNKKPVGTGHSSMLPWDTCRSRCFS
ncbi:ABC transporter substrate-binding protein [Methylobacterium sp. CM6241]